MVVAETADGDGAVEDVGVVTGAVRQFRSGWSRSIQVAFRRRAGLRLNGAARSRAPVRARSPQVGVADTANVQGRILWSKPSSGVVDAEGFGVAGRA